MKFEFRENKWNTNIELTPETPEEVAKLFKLTKNSKAVKPNIHLTFYDAVYCNISFPKIKEFNQITSLSNNK
jgi:hypothetical protein